MKSQYFRFAVLFVSALALAGCGAITKPGAPDQSFDIDQDIQDLEDEFKNKNVTVTGFYADATANNRNRFISGRLTLINIQYIKFIRRFAVEKAQLDSAIDITTIGVGLAVTLVGGESVKAILGAVSTGLTGTKVIIDKNFFQEKTVPVLITAMNAERKEALVPILRGSRETLKVYSFEQALSDLHIYYQAGTFLGALQSIQKDSGVKEEIADDEIKALVVGIVSEELQARRELAAAFVKTLDQANLDSLAETLGVSTGDPALGAILRAIAGAQTDATFNVIARKLKILFNREI